MQPINTRKVMIYTWTSQCYRKPRGIGDIFNNKTRFLIFSSALILCLGYLILTTFPNNTVYYFTVDELLAAEHTLDGRDIRVVGKLVPESFQRTTGTTIARFSLHNTGETISASYDGILPDLFFNPNSDIVLEGQYQPSGHFATKNIVVKCPSKYQALEQPE